jgi:hypothetical protein
MVYVRTAEVRGTPVSGYKNTDVFYVLKNPHSSENKL